MKGLLQPLALALLLAVSGGVIWWRVREQQARFPAAKPAPPTPKVPTDEKVGPFTLTDLDGRSVAWKDLVGEKPLVVAFWSIT